MGSENNRFRLIRKEYNEPTWGSFIKEIIVENDRYRIEYTRKGTYGGGPTWSVERGLLIDKKTNKIISEWHVGGGYWDGYSPCDVPRFVIDLFLEHKELWEHDFYYIKKYIRERYGVGKNE